MFPREYQKIRETLGLTHDAVAKLLQVHPQSPRRWAVSGVYGPSAMLLRLMANRWLNPETLSWKLLHKNQGPVD